MVMQGQRAQGMVALTVVAMFACLVAVSAAQASGNSAATVTGAFADSCRDFAAHSSKDISHVEIHYVSSLVIKNESINSHDHAIDGGTGDEIAFAIVKSGTTSEQFDCVASNTAPTALLEIKTPSLDLGLLGCADFFSGGYSCEQSSPRTAWTTSLRIPDNGGSDSGIFHWGCGFFTDHSQCSMIVSFRGIGSSDPDGDIVSWSLDFGDGTSVSGSWSTAPPTEIAHDYTNTTSGCSIGGCFVTLTVTDSAGQSASDVIRMYFLDQTPD